VNPARSQEPRFYDEGKAKAYRNRSPARKAAEENLVRRILSNVPPGAALDVPCGEGRMLGLLEEMGFRPFGLDFSPGMLRLAGGGIRARAEALPFRDRSFHLVLCHRFLHHLPPSGQDILIREIARVAEGWILVSFFHPVSLHGLKRRIRLALSRKPGVRHTTLPARLEARLGAEGFRPRRYLAQAPYLREYWLALFERDRKS